MAATTANLISLANEDTRRDVVIQNIENTITSLEDNAWDSVYILALLRQIKDANAQRTTDIEDRDRQAIEIDQVLLRYRTEGHIDGMTRFDSGDEGDDDYDDDDEGNESVTYGVIEQEIAEDEELSARLEREHRERVREHRERRRQERRQRRNAGISPTAASSAVSAVNDTISVTGTSIVPPGGEGEPDADAAAGVATDTGHTANPNIAGVLSDFDTDMVDTFISLTEEQIEALVDLMTPEQRQRFQTVFASIVEGERDIVVDAGTGGSTGNTIVSTAIVIDDESDIVDDINGNYSSDSDDDAGLDSSETSDDDSDSDSDTDGDW